jgi:hypothetical protein
MDESTLRQRAREAILMGRLPNRPPDRMWGGPGNCAACAICGESLARADVCFDLEFADDPTVAKVKQNYHLHVRCFAAWELERESTARPLSARNGAGTIRDRERDSPYRGST